MVVNIKRNFRCGLVIARPLSIFSAQVHVPFTSCGGFFDLVVEDTNLRKRHFFVKKCPLYCIIMGWENGIAMSVASVMSFYRFESKGLLKTRHMLLLK